MLTNPRQIIIVILLIQFPASASILVGFQAVVKSSVDCRVFGVRGEARGFADSLTNGALRFPEGRVNRRLMAKNERENELVVQQQGSVVGPRIHQPQQENAFGQIVKWNPEEENVGEEFEKGEKGVSDPVSQPLGVVILLFAFDRLYGCISGVNKSDEVAKEGGAISNNQIQCRQSDQACNQCTANFQDNEETWDFGFVLQFGEKIGEKVLLMQRLIETDFPALVSHVVVVVVVVGRLGSEETRGINYGEIVSFRKNIYVLT